MGDASRELNMEAGRMRVDKTDIDTVEEQKYRCILNLHRPGYSLVATETKV